MPPGRREPAAGLMRPVAVWVAVLYFIEGFPFGLVVDNLPIYFRSKGVSLEALGWMQLLGLPWAAKVLWAPMVDRYLSPRQWIAGALLVMAGAFYVLPFLPVDRLDSGVGLVLLVVAIASATQDIAIDGHTIRIVPAGGEGTANGIRTAAYRAALIVSGGMLVALAEWLPWVGVFHTAAGTMVALSLLVWTRLPEGETRLGGHGEESWWQPLLEWLRRPGAPVLFVFVLIYKLGDTMMGPMVKPFWVDRGFGPAEIGMVSTTFGVAATVAGAMLGGVLTSAWGIRTGLWVFGLAQAVPNLGYGWVAFSEVGRWGVYGASLCDSFAGGMGTAAFMAFLMSVCDRRRAATEYAALSAIFALTRHLIAPISGFAAARMGYGAYFAMTFLLAFPGLLLVPAVAKLSARSDRSRQADAAPASPD